MVLTFLLSGFALPPFVWAQTQKTVIFPLDLTKRQTLWQVTEEGRRRDKVIRVRIGITLDKTNPKKKRCRVEIRSPGKIIKRSVRIGLDEVLSFREPLLGRTYQLVVTQIQRDHIEAQLRVPPGKGVRQPRDPNERPLNVRDPAVAFPMLPRKRAGKKTILTYFGEPGVEAPRVVKSVWPVLSSQENASLPAKPLAFKVRLNSKGQVESVHIVKGQGFAVAKRLKREIESHWVFKPALLHGRPVASETVLELDLRHR